VMFTLLRTLTGRLRDADRKRVEFGSYDAISRVSLRLVELADRFGETTPTGVRITLPFTQDELAGWVGASREAVVKALATLRRMGYVRTQRKSVVVCDVPALRRRAGY
jgi:CRP/FNR family cyclic AMP-dependent transcriptional regulator